MRLFRLWIDEDCYHVLSNSLPEALTAFRDDGLYFKLGRTEYLPEDIKIHYGFDEKGNNRNIDEFPIGLNEVFS